MAQQDAEISRSSFHAAMASGDLATIRQYFCQPAVRAWVALDDSHVDPHTRHLDDHLSLWWYTETCRHSRTPRACRRRGCCAGRRTPFPVLAFQSVVDRGHVHVVEWFFSTAAGGLALMTRTLARLLPEVGRLAVQAHSVDMTEILLTAAARVLGSEHEPRRTLLTKLVAFTTEMPDRGQRTTCYGFCSRTAPRFH